MDTVVGTSLRKDMQSSTGLGTDTNEATYPENGVQQKIAVAGNDDETVSERLIPRKRPRVQHVYHDYSVVTHEETIPRDSKPPATMEFNFVEKLHYLLSDMEKDHLEHIAAWQPHGRCFIVRRPNLFETKILPV